MEKVLHVKSLAMKMDPRPNVTGPDYLPDGMASMYADGLMRELHVPTNPVPRIHEPPVAYQ